MPKIRALWTTYYAPLIRDFTYAKRHLATIYCIIAQNLGHSDANLVNRIYSHYIFDKVQITKLEKVMKFRKISKKIVIIKYFCVIMHANILHNCM